MTIEATRKFYQDLGHKASCERPRPRCRNTTNHATGRKRREEIMQMIESYVSNNGFPPSIREIGEEVGLQSVSTVHAHLKILEQEGKLRRVQGQVRAIELLTPVPSEVDRLRDLLRRAAERIAQLEGMLEVRSEAQAT